MSATRLLLRFGFIFLYWGLAGFSVAQAGVSSAEVSVPEKKIKNISGAEQTYQIRCWQEGKLLFEESDWVLTPEQARHVMVKAKTQKAEAGVMVVEIRNSLCLLKQVNGSDIR